MVKRAAREIARRHGELLPAFPNRQEAERYWFAFRDEHLALLAQLAQARPDLSLDYTLPSLTRLEQWYVQLVETDTFPSIGATRETFETGVAMYWGETVVRQAGAQWVIGEYYLAPSKYELGVAREGFRFMLHRFADHFRASHGKRQQSLLRLYRRYFGRIASPSRESEGR